MSLTIDDMMHGVQPLAEFCAGLDLGPAKRAKIAALAGLAGLQRRALRELPPFPKRRRRRTRELEALRGLKLRSRRPRGAAPVGPHALSPEAIADFERTGVSEPFRLLSAREAEQLAAQSERWEQTDFQTHTALSQACEDSLRGAGTWTINYSGLYQALRKRPLWEVLTMPELSDRVASLLGEDLLCWRSQFFEKRPGAAGTFWHQNSAFRETARGNKLAPPAGVAVDPGMLSLNVWIALRDATVANGALRIMPGSFEDGRFEYMYGFAMDHMLEFLGELPPETLRPVLAAGLFSSGSFQRVQAVFEGSRALLGIDFAGREVRDLTLRAGEAVIFTSLNMHASHPNVTSGDTRLALVGRYTAADVSVYPGLDTNHFPCPDGPIAYSLAKLPPFLVRGQVDRSVNPRARVEPYPESVRLRGEI